MKGRTVFLLICLSILVSSFVTMLVMSPNLQQGATLDSAQEAEEGPDENSSANESVDLDSEASTDLRKLEEAYEIILNNYVLEVDEEKLLEGAIDGMLETLEDPYSVYMDAEEAEQFAQNFQSSFEGIGAEVMMRDGKVTIVSPIRDSPAEEAGLRPNDQILSVNGDSLEGLNINQAVMKIRGEKGTEAELEISRPGNTDSMTVTVVRDEIPLETVYAETFERDGKTIGYIELTSFAQQTAERFAEELTDFEEAGIDALLIDVRGNPGGYLDAVREIGQFIVPDESIITEIQDRDGEQVVYRSTLEDRKPYPIAVLIDEGSASASEILAAALQEAGGYSVIGEQSFGKGTVQSTMNMEDDSEIKITIAKWLTPNENWINEVGVQPDVEVSQPEFYRAARISTDPELERDMNNDHVQNLQHILQGLGYDPGRTDGFFSAETKRAVEQFQRDNNLQPTGVVGEETALALEEELTEVLSDLDSDEQLQKALEVLLDEID